MSVSKTKRLANELLMYHEIIVAAFQYAVDLEWVKENIMAQVNPCADEAPILFTDFLLEWLDMMKNSRGSHNVCFLLHIHQKQHHPIFPGPKAHASRPGKAPKVHPGILSARTERRAVREYSHTTATRTFAKCLQYAFQIGLIKSNPADRVERPRKAKYVATIYNQDELETLFNVVRGDPIELAVILAAF